MLSPNFFTGKTFICHWLAWNLNSWQEYLIYMFPVVTWLKGGQMIVCLGEEWVSISKIVGSSKFKYVIPFNIFKYIATIAKYPFIAICYFSNTATEFPCINRVWAALTLLTVLFSSVKKGFFTVLLSPTSQAWHAKTVIILLILQQVWSAWVVMLSMSQTVYYLERRIPTLPFSLSSPIQNIL